MITCWPFKQQQFVILVMYLIPIKNKKLSFHSPRKFDFCLLTYQRVSSALAINILYFTQEKAMKKTSQLSKNFSKSPEKIPSHIQASEKARIFQKNLVFVNGLCCNLGNQETLTSEHYFGRYGKVNKIIIKTVHGFKNKSSHRAYVTFDSQMEASLAIVALDGFKLEKRTLKASYGTTKYCSYFLKGFECKNPQCYFLHELDKKEQIINVDDTRSAFKKQNQQALQIVRNNLDYVVGQLMLEEGKQSLFPSLQALLNMLIDTGYTSEKEINSLKKKLDLKKKKSNFQKPPLAYKEKKSETPLKYTEKGIKKQFYSEKKGKNVEEKDEQHEEQKKVERKGFSQIQYDIISQLSNQFDAETRCGKEVSLADTREFELQDRIEKMIIRKLLRTNGKAKSKMNFVKSDKAQTDQLVRLRGIVQQFLISKH